MKHLALVFVGSGAGGALRYLVGLLALRLGAASFVGTMIVNVVGTFVAVLVAQWLARNAGGADAARVADVRALVSVGVLGGFTTYSAFQVDVLGAVARGAWGQAALVLVVTVGACLAAGALALALSR